MKRARPHRAWGVAAVTFVALVGAAGFRATPGVLIIPLQAEFGWSRATISLAVSMNLLLFGLTAPFAAALMERHGWRSASITVSVAALAVVPLVLLVMRERPSDLGLLPYGASGPVPPPPRAGPPARAAVGALRRASGGPAFWLLVGGFANAVPRRTV